MAARNAGNLELSTGYPQPVDKPVDELPDLVIYPQLVDNLWINRAARKVGPDIRG